MLLKNGEYLNKDMNFIKGDITIEDGCIHLESLDAANEQEIDCSDYFILPGLYNSHFHGYSTMAKGLGIDREIQDWCDDSAQGKLQSSFFEFINTLSNDDYSTLIQQTYIDMIKKGITFVSDCSPGPSPQTVFEAMDQVGIKGVIDTYNEISKYAGTGNEKITFVSHLLEEEDIDETELEECQHIKDTYETLFMTHCMENNWRKDLILSKYGKSSVQIFHERGLLDKAILFHGVHLTDLDLQIIKETQSSIVHCPVSNAWSGAGLARVKAMLEKKINVCLGTDFGSTDIWEVMRLSYYLLKFTSSAEEYSARDIFKMAAAGGANAYNQKKSGLIAEGYKADLIFIQKSADLYPLITDSSFSNGLHNILHEVKDEHIHHVMIDGSWVLRDREMKTVNEQEIDLKYKAIIGQLQQSLGRSINAEGREE